MAQPKEKKGIFGFFQKILDFFLSLIRTPKQQRAAKFSKQEKFNIQEGQHLTEETAELFRNREKNQQKRIQDLQDRIAMREKLIELLEKSKPTPADQKSILDIRNKIGATDNLEINKNRLEEDKVKLNRLLAPPTKSMPQDLSKKPVTPVTKASNKSKGTGFMRKAMGFFGLGNQKIIPIKTSGAAEQSASMPGKIPERTPLEQAQMTVDKNVKTLKEIQEELNKMGQNRGGGPNHP
jgi:hypothetical protein